MTRYKKCIVNLNDDTYHYAQDYVGSLKEVCYGSATIWYSWNDYEHYTLDREVAKFYDDLADALTNLKELQSLLTGVYRHLYKEDAAQMVSNWIYDSFHYAFDDASEMVRLFAHWKDARAAFIDMIKKDAPEDVEPLEDFKRVA